MRDLSAIAELLVQFLYGQTNTHIDKDKYRKYLTKFQSCAATERNAKPTLLRLSESTEVDSLTSTVSDASLTLVRSCKRTMLSRGAAYHAPP